jgi:glycosyltransferase involved in cell wall biosynthesis
VRLSVLVPTYRRPTYLVKCLRALEQQRRHPDQVIVVVRDCDAETQELLGQCSFRLPLELVVVNFPGQVCALNAGLDWVDGEIVAITDDDAAPYCDWLQRIEHHFQSDSTLAGVGGRDFIRDGHTYSNSPVVGKIQWFGRQIGNHHRGVGAPRYVDVLKGANMSYRMDAIGALRFDTRLLGAGAQVHNDMAFSLQLRRRGWSLIYDPAVAVDHFCGDRFDDDGRVFKSQQAIMNKAHNETVAILDYLPGWRRAVFLAWAIVIGHRGSPGFAQCLRLALLHNPAWASLVPVITGRLLGVKTILRTGDSTIR